MLIKPRVGQQKVTGSLSVQIQRAQQKLIDRKQRIVVHSAHLGHQLRANLASPAALLFAGGSGFVLAEFANRPIKVTLHEEAQPTKSAQSRQHSSILSSIKPGTVLSLLLPLIYPSRE